MGDKDVPEWKVKNPQKEISIMVARNNKLKNLNINPLSVVKFFYKKLGERALDPAFIQPIIYLCCKELEKKEQLLLFAEKFKTNEYTPFLSSLDKLLEDEKKLVREFNKSGDINNPLIIKYLEKIANKHNDNFACELQFKARNNGGRSLAIR